MQITDFGLEFITITNLVSVFLVFSVKVPVIPGFSFYKDMVVGYSFLIFQNPGITTLPEMGKEKKVQIGDNLQIITAVPEKGIKHVYSLNIKTLNLKE